MKALLCVQHGPPELLVMQDLPMPTPAGDEVIVKVSYAGLNFFDTLIIENKYQFKPPLPFSIASECAGEVYALGNEVQGFHEGDRVITTSPMGASRQYIAVKASSLTRIPKDLSSQKAAGLTVTYGTTIHALKDRAELKPGETLAILGASGGVGLAAIEIGKAMGATVIACCSSQDKVDFCTLHGADLGLNYGEEDLKEGLKRLTNGKGVDVLYDPVGDKRAEPAVRSMAWKGRYLVIGFAGGEIPKIPLNLLLLKGCDIRGVFWGDFARREPLKNAQNMAQVMEWAASEAISVHIDKEYTLEEGIQALNDLKNRKVRGKALLKL